MAATLGENVRNHRRRVGLTQEGLAERAGLGVGTVRKVEQVRTAEIATLHMHETWALLAAAYRGSGV
ncbi:helix-turn-helix domain-containing protein [Yinghuangia seranimata]|uniref:helix-turn-helix domain-containing protein n=1 Tax=Yinghuangia seranimata TaxID=408067 RepID=UPI00248C8021|nr:helix-turn-helix domain-containing protein [Yinghuangia seranimata]MDI2132243.1 helix-turn-helix domain-containing protein [Yinghuangia seranimata]